MWSVRGGTFSAYHRHWIEEGTLPYGVLHGDSATVLAVPDDVCPEKIRLTREYHELTMNYSTAVSTLFSEIQFLSKKQYEEGRKVVEEAVEASSKARKGLDRHVEQHGC